MSEKSPQQSQSEEVDLGQLFNAIGRLFEKLFSFIGGIFKTIFSAIIYALKPIVNNFKLVMIAVLASAVIGFIAEKVNEPIYVSDMLVKPYFGSKYQLANNIDYFNALVGSNNLKELSNIFEIDTVLAQKLIRFDIKIGPETQNDLMKEYNDYIKSIDSTLATDLTYEEFIENRDILSGNVFSIQAFASSNDIFSNLEKGFIKTFENDYSKKLKSIRDSTLLTKKAAFQKQLSRIDSLQRIYIEIKKSESDSNDVTIGPSGMFPLTQQKTTTREFELFQEEIKVRSAIRALDETLIEESVFYDILSRFEEVGTVKKSIYEKYSIIFPLVVLIIMMTTYFSIKAFKYIKEYE